MKLSLLTIRDVGHLLGAIALFSLMSCASAPESTPSSSDPSSPDASSETSPSESELSQVEQNDTSPASPDATFASVTAVDVTGEPGAYSFSVTVSSPDTGCDQYADWWEVITDDGALIHRRVLLHSHVSEQPFTRSSSPVEVQADQPVIVRSHMSATGYGPQAMGGTVADGFQEISLPEGFASDLADQGPLPDGCTY